MRRLEPSRVALFVALFAACDHPRQGAPSPEDPGVVEGPRISALGTTASVVTTACSAEPPAAAARTPRDAGPAKHPLRWTKVLSLASLAALPAAFGEAVLRDGDALELRPDEGPNEGSDRRTVRTCAEYLPSIAAGFVPQTTFGISQGSFFLERCNALAFLRDAWGSDESFVAGLRLDRDPLRTLPATMNTAMEAPSDEEKAVMAKGQRLGAFDRDLVVMASSATSVTLEHRGTDSTRVDIVAWGDLDHDGIEDVLLVQAHASLQGSFRMYRAFVATRTSPTEPLRVVRELR
jgi:hypothetical protein